jgi:hypothetical protein
MRESVQPERPRTRICCCFSSSKTLLMLATESAVGARVNVSPVSATGAAEGFSTHSRHHVYRLRLRLRGARLRPLHVQPTTRARLLERSPAFLRAGQSDRAVRYAHGAHWNIGGRMARSREGWFPGASSAWTLPIEALWRRGDLRGAAAELDRACADCPQLAESARTDLAGSLITANLSLCRARAATAVKDLIGRANDRHFN